MIKNVNEKFGEPLVFESPDEMLEAVQASYPEVTELTEGIDYIEI